MIALLFGIYVGIGLAHPCEVPDPLFNVLGRLQIGLLWPLAYL